MFEKLTAFDIDNDGRRDNIGLIRNGTSAFLSSICNFIVEFF